MALGVAQLFASSLTGGAAPGGGGLPNPLGGAAVSSADTGDVALGGFGDFNVGAGAGSGAVIPAWVWLGAGVLALVALLRRR
jgi:hypothetical protein